MGDNSKSNLESKGLIFEISSYKREHYEDKDLIDLTMTIDNKKFKLSFLLGKYDTLFFPEFKKLDAYGNSGFSVMQKFLSSIKSKVDYYYQTQVCCHLRNRGINTWDPYKEWWQEEGLANAINDELEEWVISNTEYMVQFDFKELDEDSLDELVDYINDREDFVKPIFKPIKTSIGIDKLREELELAIENEDYEVATKLRDKINEIKKKEKC